MNQRVHVLAVDADRNALHLPGLDVVLENQFEREPHPGVSERAAWVRFDRNAGEGERPRVAELAFDRPRVEPAARRLEETAAGFEDDRRRGETELGQFRGEDAAFARAACMKGLRHRAEILAQPRGLARGKPQRAPRAFAIEAEQVCGARGGAERDRKSTRLNSSHGYISYAVFCLKKKKKKKEKNRQIDTDEQ